MGNLYPFLEVVRIPQILDLYRANGLPLVKYLIEKTMPVEELFLII